MDTIINDKSCNDSYYKEHFPKWIDGIDKAGRPGKLNKKI